MKVVAVIAEYNPFHLGHKYQLDTIRQLTNADYIIVAMSGDFLQRGVPACFDKFHRTKMALLNGADLVLELPTIWATSSAEFFAKAGVSLLQNTGIVTHLAFGAEEPKLDSLFSIAQVLKKEPINYKEALSFYMHKGYSFPTARSKALKEILPNTTKDEWDSVLSAPNNILAIEYLKALPNQISPLLIPRNGAGYHDTNLQSPLPSATAIRQAIARKEISGLKNAMPFPSFQIAEELITSNNYLEIDDFSEILGYKLLSVFNNNFEKYADCNQDISNKISNALPNYRSFHDFCSELKSKDITYTRLSRILIHILLDIKQNDYIIGQRLGYCPYLRVLGFRQSSKGLLSQIKKEAPVPLISKVTQATSKLSPDALAIFQKDLYASALYQQALTVQKGQAPKNDFTSQMIVL